MKRAVTALVALLIAVVGMSAGTAYAGRPHHLVVLPASKTQRVWKSNNWSPATHELAFAIVRDGKEIDGRGHKIEEGEDCAYLLNIPGVFLALQDCKQPGGKITVRYISSKPLKLWYWFPIKINIYPEGG
jgi:hypothetical protein